MILISSKKLDVLDKNLKTVAAVFFLNMRAKIVNDEITSEKASVVVGEEWFKRHVNINKPPEKFVRANKRSKKTDDN